MASIISAKAYCNNEVAYLAWTSSGKIPGCLGFEVTRVYLNADDTVALRPDGTEDRVELAAYVAFKGQGNTALEPAGHGRLAGPENELARPDASQTARCAPRVDPITVQVRYDIRPIGNLKSGMTPVPSNGRETIRDRETGQQKPGL